DQAIVSAFLLPLFSGKDLYQLELEIVYAIQLAMPSFERAKKKALSMKLIDDPFLDLPNTSYLSADAKFWQWIRQLTAALVFDATEIFVGNVNWDETMAWSPHRIQSQ